MKRIFFKTLVFFFFFFLFFIFYQSQSRAFADYQITIDPRDANSGQDTSSRDYLTAGCSPGEQACNNNPVIPTENTRTVYVTFTGLSQGESYKYCIAEQDDCQAGHQNQAEDTVGLPASEITFPVCAHGKSALKFAKKDEDNNGKIDDNEDHEFKPNDSGDISSWRDFHCEEDDYFFGQKTYNVSLFTKNENLIDNAPIYIAHYYPLVKINDKDIKIFDDKDNLADFSHLNLNLAPYTLIKIKIKGNRRPFDKDGRNNYKIEIARQDNPGNLWGYDCVTVPDGDTSPVADIDGSGGIKLPQGDYILKINERNNEGFGRGCGAGYSYYYIYFTVESDRTGGIQEVLVDPNGEDLKRVEKIYDIPLLRCEDKVIGDTTPGCPKVRTALGTIETNPAGFVKSVFGLILSLSGGIALLLIIYSGYKLMAARGEPEALKGARDQLIAAIIGLIFIIFSLVILQIIGVDILRIPGFGQ